MTNTETTWIVKLARLIMKKGNWFKVLILLIVIGIFTMGFTCEWGKFKITKDPIIKYKRTVEVKK